MSQFTISFLLVAVHIVVVVGMFDIRACGISACSTFHVGRRNEARREEGN
jgi:hypothetical protein